MERSKNWILPAALLAALAWVADAPLRAAQEPEDEPEASEEAMQDESFGEDLGAVQGWDDADFAAAAATRLRVPAPVGLEAKATLLDRETVSPLLLNLASDAKSLDAEDLQDKAVALGVPLEGRTVSVALHAESSAGAEALESAVRAAGGKVTFGEDNVVYADVPVSKVAALGGTDGLYFMAPQSVDRASESDKVRQRREESVKAAHVDHLHAAGVKGKGVKVGILDFGFQHYGKLQAEGALPAPKVAKAFNKTGNIENGVEHGTACAEIIHDLAPEAELYLAAVGEGGQATESDVLQAWAFLQEQGVDIISYSGGSPFGRKDGKSVKDTRIDGVAGKGILPVVAAGNEGDAGHLFFEAKDADKDGWIDIPGPEGKPVQGVFFKPFKGQVGIELWWDDWGDDPALPSASQDIDLVVYKVDLQARTAKQIGVSANPQRGRGEPREGLYGKDFKDDDIFMAQLKATNVTRPVKMHVWALPAFAPGKDRMAPITPTGTIGSPATANKALAVAAVEVKSANLEPYSSQGPTDDGRTKPDVAAFARTFSLAYGDRWAGTSASAPHVSGYTALLKQLNPQAKAEELRALVVKNVRGSGTANNQVGMGIIDGSKLTPRGSSLRGEEPEEPMEEPEEEGIEEGRE